MLGANQILHQDREWEKHHRFSLTGRGIQRDEGIRLRISKSPESNIWRSAEAQNQGEISMRFAARYES